MAARCPATAKASLDVSSTGDGVLMLAAATRKNCTSLRASPAGNRTVDTLRKGEYDHNVFGDGGR